MSSEPVQHIFNRNECSCHSNHYGKNMLTAYLPSKNGLFYFNPQNHQTTEGINMLKDYCDGWFDDIVNIINNNEILFNEGLCPFTLWQMQNHQSSNSQEEKQLIGEVFIEMYSFLKTKPSNYSNPFKTISTSGDLVIKSINRNYYGGCVCGFCHTVNGTDYDYAFEINGKLVGIDASKSLIVNLVRICDELDVSKAEVIHLYSLLFDGFSELAIFSYGLFIIFSTLNN